MKIRKGDMVRVLAGKDIGKDGEVTRVIPEKSRVIVDGVNVAKKHQKQQRQTMQAGIIDKDMPIHVSNVAILCSRCGPTRVGYEFDDEGNKYRVCVKCGEKL
ncbi:MAG TPA: 50S ribosomal protein L24 [Acidimicrobiia bacterium]|jgi:large subunit ribosomal protein L24|nr:50S ribosomal protein L24 [Acidimicrobiia bacterium]